MSNKKAFKYILVSAILLFLTFLSIRSSIVVFKSKSRLDEVEKEISNLEKEKKKLEEDIAYKKTPEYIEETARNELNLVKPEEEIYVVVNSGKKDQEEVLSSSDKKDGKLGGKEDKNRYSWYKLFFN